MQILVKDKYIISYAQVGGVKDGIDIDDTAIPNDFFESFEPKKYMYVNGVVISNEEYKESNGMYTPTNTEIMLAQIQLQVAEISCQIKGVDGLLNMYPVFETIKYSYGINCYTDEQIKRFVELKCITEEQYKEITGEDYE